MSLAIRETKSRASHFGPARTPNSWAPINFICNRKEIEMRRISTRCSLLITMFALTSFSATSDDQNENLIATKATNQPVDMLSAGPSETKCCKSVISKGQLILQPGTLRAPGRAPINLWGMPRIPTDTPGANRKSRIGAGPGFLPLGAAVQPDVTQKYGTNPGALQVYFGHRP